MTRMLWGLMGMYLLNISVNTADPEPEHIPEDLSINDMESFIEIFVELILGYEDAFKEYDDHDTEDHTQKTSSPIDLINRPLVDFLSRQILYEHVTYKHCHQETYLAKGFHQLDTPPPKA